MDDVLVLRRVTFFRRFIAPFTLLVSSACLCARRRVDGLLRCFPFRPGNALLQFSPNGQGRVLNEDVPAFVGMVTDGLSLFVGETTSLERSRIVRYSLDGQYRDVFANLPCDRLECGIIALQRDSVGNFYATTGNSDWPYGGGDNTVYRVRPTGGVELIYRTQNYVWGVDADANGRIYVAQRNQILRFTPDFLLEISFPTPLFYPSAISIDEFGERLFLADQQGGVIIYDMATDTPALIGEIRIPETVVIDLDYDAWSGHVFLTNFNGGVELAVDGTLVRGLYVPPYSFGTGVASLAAGDFNDDGRMDANDIDRLVAAIVSQSQELAFDLNDDGVLNVHDRDHWLTLAADANLMNGSNYLLGDANLDGLVDGQDFVRWNTNKFQQLASWSAGDFTADGIVDASDLSVLLANIFQAGAAPSPIPEPRCLIVYFLALLLLRCRSRLPRRVVTRAVVSVDMSKFWRLICICPDRSRRAQISGFGGFDDFGHWLMS